MLPRSVGTRKTGVDQCGSTASIYKHTHSAQVVVKMLTNKTNMGELLNRFMETSCLTIKPEHSRVHQLVILRFIYSFGASADVDTCTQLLLNDGVAIGSYEKISIEVTFVCLLTHRHQSSILHALTRLESTTQNGLKHLLTSMEINEWVEMICIIHVDGFPNILYTMQKRYQQEQRNTSPLLLICQTLTVFLSIHTVSSTAFQV